MSILRRISYKGINTNWLVLKRLPVAGFEAPSDIVAITLGNLGIPVPADFNQTILLKGGHFIGYKYRWNGGYALMLVGSSTIEFLRRGRQAADDRRSRN